ncbi:hypothetical protein [Sinosporangium siamense]|uniref:Protein kinase domain-containing protein n=1 Tax=Sinosporangium siamense TaxID=1367973 RepID=A0A919RE10_9ACTN|nr:hypothetical protein [Sinosporangium siamense]GII90054.1 hypothetical protein Ssi02_02850 [Sinosporangium siamense]
MAEQLWFLSPEGVPHTWEIAEADVGAVPVPEGSLTAIRRVKRAGDGMTLVRKYVPIGVGAMRPEAYEQLENEIRIALRLLHRLGDSAYPRELVRVVGYDADAEEPFILYEDFPGEPILSRAGKLHSREERKAVIGLFRAADAMRAAGVVHGGIEPATVYWSDSGGVRVVSFEGAAVVDQDRWSVPRGAPWAAPELRGEAPAPPHPSADVWSAAMLTYYVVTARKVDDRQEPALHTMGEALQHWLAGTFVPAGDRVTARTVLERLKEGRALLPKGENFEARLREGGARFDDALAAKRSRHRPVTTASPPRRTGLWIALLVTLIAVVAGVAAVAVLVN